VIFAADVGGTNARLGLFERSRTRLAVVASKTYSSRQHASLEEIVKRFMSEHPATPKRACVAIAGPVSEGRAVATNLAWGVDARRLGQAVGLREVALINDLQAVAHGPEDLDETDVAVLHPGAPGAQGNRAIIAAGTGLGEAGAYWDGRQHHPFASEGAERQGWLDWRRAVCGPSRLIAPLETRRYTEEQRQSEERSRTMQLRGLGSMVNMPRVGEIQHENVRAAALSPLDQ
jgi:hypothetical protein